MRVYVAGPMTRIPQFNFPAFDQLAEWLRSDKGYDVISPAEIDDPAARAAALASVDGDPIEYQRITGLTWADFLSRDVKLIADGGFDMVVCLPGWTKSRGARLETFVAYLSGIAIQEYNPITGRLYNVSLGYLLEAWGGEPLNVERLDSLVAVPE